MPDQTVIACGIQAGTNVVVPVAVDAAGHPIIQLDTLSNAAGIIVTGSAAGIVSIPNQALSRAFLGANQAIPNAVVTQINLNLETYDVQNEFDPLVNYRYTATEDGYYVILAQIRYNPTVAATVYQARVHINGLLAFYSLDDASTASGGYVNTGDIRYLAAGDFVELHGYHKGGAGIVARGHTAYTWLSIGKIA